MKTPQIHLRFFKSAVLTLISLLIFPQTGCTAPTDHEPILGGPCEGCQAIFQGLPDSIGNVTQITSPKEPGERLVLNGTVKDASGKIARGVIVYIYHTNAEGEYPPDTAFPGEAAYRHGLLRGWAKTDSLGYYEFRTIRPASYPNTDIAQHVHMHILEPGCATYFIDEIHFTDDPLFTPPPPSRTRNPRGGDGVVRPVRDSQRVWRATRDITLGAFIPGYQNCSSQKM